jgi:hypothetical protein
MSYICFWACYENASGYVTCYKTLGTFYATWHAMCPSGPCCNMGLTRYGQILPCRQNVEELSLPSWSRKPRLGHDDSWVKWCSLVSQIFLVKHSTQVSRETNVNICRWLSFNALWDQSAKQLVFAAHRIITHSCISQALWAQSKNSN